jgi:hypothetical protein
LSDTTTIAPPQRRESQTPEHPQKPPTTSDVLHRAADLLEEWGWKQFDYGSKEEGAFCALGAMDEARVDLLGPYWFKRPEAYAPERIFRPERGIPEWNDTPGRTKAEVVAALREAARRAL